MDIDVQEGPLEMRGKLQVSYKKVFFGEMEDAACIPAGLVKRGGAKKEVKG